MVGGVQGFRCSRQNAACSPEVTLGSFQGCHRGRGGTMRFPVLWKLDCSALSFTPVHREPGCPAAKQPGGDRDGHAADQGECGEDAPSFCVGVAWALLLRLRLQTSLT